MRCNASAQAARSFSEGGAGDRFLWPQIETGHVYRNRSLRLAKELEDIVRPHFTTANFLVYDESKKVHMAHLIVAKLPQYHAMLHDLHAVQSNLSFCRSEVRKMFDSLGTNWESMTNGVRNGRIR